MYFKIGDIVRMWTAPDQPDFYGVIVRSAGVGAFAVQWLRSGIVSNYCAAHELVKVAQ